MTKHIMDMENYIVSARKYRPATFATVVGQESLTTTLKNAIRSGQLAHAYLFCGPRGVGKTTCARIFARTINCMNPRPDGEACNECESCKAFNEQRSYNIHELDAASNNSVDDIRQLIDQVRIPPQIGKYKVFIIDEVHMLSTAAFNAFLKTLEEPPRHAVFVLATTEKHKLLPTILSRCQIYDFNRMKVADIVGHLRNVAEKEGVKAEEAALNVIAQKADGGMRDALSIFDQVNAFCGGNITYDRTIENLNVLDYDYYFRLADYFLGKKVTESILTFDEILRKGFDGQHFIGGLASHLRNLLVSKDVQTVGLIEASEEVRKRYAEQSRKCEPRFLYAAIKLCNDCDLAYRQSQNKRLLVELTLIQVCQLESGDDLPSSGLCPTKKLKPLFAGAAGAVAGKSSRESGKQASAPAQPVVAADAGHTYGQHIADSARRVQRPSEPPAQAGKVSRSGSFSIRDAMRQMETDKSASPNTDKGIPDSNGGHERSVGVRNEQPVDNIQIRTAWREFSASLPVEETAMSNRLNNMEPELTEDGFSFLVLADNPTVEEQLNKYANRIEEYMHSRLNNDRLRMLVRQREQGERPRAYNKHEQFVLMCSLNPALQKLKDEFGLELGG